MKCIYSSENSLLQLIWCMKLLSDNLTIQGYICCMQNGYTMLYTTLGIWQFTCNETAGCVHVPAAISRRTDC